ncbi:restriction endonuclease subunit S [Bacillus haynesii]|uniref:restriction endonuclease subunit S n=1 Tax=Bacillus haynesii TaxID=1925021 RepID=UPI0022808040|nr:restriction endonuclease subunit S [Bacillus haynesii]MCY7998437.1 restriction endonuclease subunit S [Bacillus haynesii]MCY9264742.1 restriction endonuclease subunit S [Bacillus haynesii]MEC1534215.1 restriction endonuclease subunit S [Bacillus haynesii]
MSNIVFKKLGDLATFINGYPFKTKDWASNGLPIIRIQNLNNKNAPFNYYNSEINEKFLVKKGDILISWSGSIGIYEWEGEDALLNQHIYKVDFNKDIINKTYFKYIVKISLDKALQYLHGSTMKHITKKYFEQIPVPVPDLNKQKNIAELLEVAKSLIDKRKAQIAALSDLTHSVFLEMFGDPIKNTRKWNLKSFEEIAKIDTTMVKNFDNYLEYKYIGIDNIEKNTGRLVNVKTVGEVKPTSSKYLFTDDHIIYSKIRPYLNKVAIPKFKGLCSADSYPILADENVTTKEFLTYILRSQLFLNHVNSQSKRTNIPKVNKKQLMDFNTICPPLDLQKDFTNKVKNIELQIEKLNGSMKYIDNIFQSLMQRAFRGELFNN